MTDSPITGEHQIVLKPPNNNGPTWRWLVGAMAGVIVVVGGGLFATYKGLSSSIADVKTATVRIEEKFNALQKESDNYWGQQQTHNAKIGSNTERIIKLESQHPRLSRDHE